MKLKAEDVQDIPELYALRRLDCRVQVNVTERVDGGYNVATSLRGPDSLRASGYFEHTFSIPACADRNEQNERLAQGVRTLAITFLRHLAGFVGTPAVGSV